MRAELARLQLCAAVQLCAVWLQHDLDAAVFLAAERAVEFRPDRGRPSYTRDWLLRAVILCMPAKSKKQQMAAGAALAAKRGDKPKSSLRGASKSMAKSIVRKS